MKPERVKEILVAALPDIQFTVTGDGHHFEIIACSSRFAQMKLIARHQLLNDALKPYLDDGSLHAVQYQFLIDEMSTGR